MPEILKVLAQSSPAATTETAIYAVPSDSSATISSVVICNRAASAGTFRISVAPSGAATTNSQYLYYDQALDANSTFVSTIGITLAATDVIRVYSSSASFSFSVFGVEVS